MITILGGTGVEVERDPGGDDVRRLVMREGYFLTGLAVALGLVSASAVTRALRGLLYGVTPLDGLTIASVVALVATVASSPSVGRPGVRLASIRRRRCARSSTIRQAQVGLSRGELEPERAAARQTRINSDGPAMGLDCELAERETQPYRMVI